MFGLGWGEMVVIGIVALIAIGPKELPTVLRSAGQWIGKIRRMAADFQGQFQEALREAELTDLKKHAEDITADISNFDPMADTQKEMEKAFEMPDPLRRAEATSSSAPVTAVETQPVPDGAKLPAGTLPPIDVPMPQLPPPVTEKDFAPAPTPKARPKAAAKEAPKETSTPAKKPAKKRAGGGK
jgi:sec-independent protein translocase protein TatB